MIRRLQVLNYRSLRYVDVALDRFHVLAGATGSGKSAFLDAIAFLGDLIRDGPGAAVRKRSDDFRGLAPRQPAGNPRFEIAAEFEVPTELRDEVVGRHDFRRFRYEIAMHDQGDGPGIEFERGILMAASEPPDSPQASLFSNPPLVSIPSGSGRRGSKTVFSKSTAGNDSFNIESAGTGSKGWAVRVSLGPRRSTLANLPETPGSFPVATHVRNLLTRRVESISLNEAALRRPGLPGRQGESLDPDGSNLAWAVRRYREANAVDFEDWVSHVRSALPGIDDLLTQERESDRHAVLAIRGTNGMDMPARAASAGVLRLIALTLVPLLLPDNSICLLRNPELELDAASLKAVYRSLSGASRAQLLASTCSPGLLAYAAPEEVLCCSLDPDGATTVVAGSEHPDFEAWSGPLDNAALFAPALLAPVPEAFRR